MKQLILIVLTACVSFAQAETPTASPTPALPTAGPAAAAMKLPPQTQSALVAGQIIQQVTTLLNQVIQVIDNGVPAQGDSPGVTAKDLQAALGTENVMRFRSAVAILSGPAPAAPVTPKPGEGGSPKPAK